MNIISGIILGLLTVLLISSIVIKFLFSEIANSKFDPDRYKNYKEYEKKIETAELVEHLSSVAIWIFAILLFITLFFILLKVITDRNNGNSKGRTKIKMIRCCNCNSQIDSNSDFCPKCGIPIKQNQIIKPTCSNCGYPIIGDAKYCIQCGKKYISN